MTDISVKTTVKRYHSPVQRTKNFVSGLWLGWGFHLIHKCSQAAGLIRMVDAPRTDK